MAAYEGMMVEEAGDYHKVRKATLKRYDINEESHRRKFRGDRKKSGETYREFIHRLVEKFQKWVKSQNMPIENVMVLEQFYQTVPEELAVWLKDRKLPFLGRGC